MTEKRASHDRLQSVHHRKATGKRATGREPKQIRNEILPEIRTFNRKKIASGATVADWGSTGAIFGCASKMAAFALPHFQKRFFITKAGRTRTVPNGFQIFLKITL